jgi:hypothetical protein
LRASLACCRIECVLQRLCERLALQSGRDRRQDFEDDPAGFAQEAGALPAQAGVEGDGDAGDFQFVVEQHDPRLDIGGCVRQLARAFREDDDLLAGGDAEFGGGKHQAHCLGAACAVDRDADARGVDAEHRRLQQFLLQDVGRVLDEHERRQRVVGRLVLHRDEAGAAFGKVLAAAHFGADAAEQPQAESLSV